MQEIVIRRARTSDAQAIHDILASAFLGMRGRGYLTLALETAAISAEDIQQRIEEGGHVLVAEAGQLVVGTASGLEEHETLHVCSVAVDPAWQGRRIAQRLMEVLEAIAQEQGCQKLWLHTAWVMTEAIALYERMGYQQEGYLPRQFYGEDFLAFGKVLKQDIEADVDVSKLRGAILIFPGVEELDFVGVYEVLAKAGSMHAASELELQKPLDVQLVAREQRLVCANGMVVHPHRRYVTLSEYDFVIVPGGLGVQALEKDSELLAELRALHQAGCLLCSVCTGALVLAWAEVLKGKKATTHHLHKERLRNHCQVVDQRIVCDGNLITAAGVSASIDLGLHLLERFYGEETSDSVAQRLEYRR